MGGAAGLMIREVCVIATYSRGLKAARDDVVWGVCELEVGCRGGLAVAAGGGTVTDSMPFLPPMAAKTSSHSTTPSRSSLPAGTAPPRSGAPPTF
jgi:hypothetical protein